MRRNAKDLGNDVAVEVDLPSPGGDERVEDGAGAEGGGNYHLPTIGLVYASRAQTQQANQTALCFR